MRLFKRVLAIAIAVAPASVYAGTTTYDVNNPLLWSHTEGANSEAVFNFDYSNYGIPLSTTGGSQPRAMRLRANINSAAAAVQGVTVSPTGVALTGDYTIKAHVWLNTFGAFSAGGSGGSGTTQFFGVGSGYTGGVNYRAGATTGGGSGTWFAVDNEGGFIPTSSTIRDFSAFTGSGAVAANFVTTASAYAANSVDTTNPQDNANSYYKTLFPSRDVTTLNNGDLATKQNAIATAAGVSPAPQTGTGVDGGPLFAWREYTIQRTGNTVTFSIDNNLIATLTNSPADGGTSITYFDATSGVSGIPDLNFALVSDYSITTPDVVPEPAAPSLVGVGALALVRRRRRRA